eukprot:3935553-Rhodomonas_salina.1
MGGVGLVVAVVVAVGSHFVFGVVVGDLTWVLAGKEYGGLVVHVKQLAEPLVGPWSIGGNGESVGVCKLLTTSGSTLIPLIRITTYLTDVTSGSSIPMC